MFDSAHRKNQNPRGILSLTTAGLIILIICPPTVGWGQAAIRQESTVEFQPLSANVKRLLTTLKNIGSPPSPEQKQAIEKALNTADSDLLLKAMDSLADLVVEIESPKGPIKFRQTRDSIRLYQTEHRPIVIKVLNRPEIPIRLDVDSDQAGAVYSGTAIFSLNRQQQTELGDKQNEEGRKDIFVDADLYRSLPMRPRLSGLKVEYSILLLHSSRSGIQTPNLWFHAANAPKETQHYKANLRLHVAKAIPVKLDIQDPTQQAINPIARIEIRDRLGNIYPNQPKRLAPDFFFQPHIYRRKGEFVHLIPGEYVVRFCRGPEYRLLEKTFVVKEEQDNVWRLDLQRWIHPEEYGVYSGDHHIHAAGCAHYSSPTQGVTPEHMYRQIAGEGLNVGCVLTWGPCFDFQRNYFSPQAKSFENRESLLKYDIEVSGFGSQALGHVCLLNLKDQTYPSSDGTKTKGWPTWTTPVMRWAKEQGGFTGYAHSASGLSIDPRAASQRIIKAADKNGDGKLNRREANDILLPFDFATIDKNSNQELAAAELVAAHQISADQLPNYSIPEMNGVGAMEICVSAAEGVCDFISAMDTARIQEWNTWYHLLNCGFPIKVSGETDFPCMSSLRVGKGRVYVDMDRRLPRGQTVDFKKWCEGLANGRSYVSDGFAHATEFTVENVEPGRKSVQLDKPGRVNIKFSVAFAPQTPSAVAHGTQKKNISRSKVGDTVELHHPREHRWIVGGTRKVEVVVNGKPVITKSVNADGKVYSFDETLTIDQSSWVAVRQFPQLHTNPVNVIVGQKPIRASRRSAEWCIGMTKLVWQNRQRTITPAERSEAQTTFIRALNKLAKISQECQID